MVKRWGPITPLWIKADYDNQIKSNLNGIGAALVNHNQITLGGQTKRPCMTDRVSKLKSYQFLKFSTYIIAQKVSLFGVILVIEQMVEEDNAGSKINDSRELFNIVKKL